MPENSFSERSPVQAPDPRVARAFTWLSIFGQRVNFAKLFFDLRHAPDAARVRFSVIWGRHHRPTALTWHDRNLDGRGTVRIGRQSFAKNPDQVGARNSFLGQQKSLSKTQDLGQGRKAIQPGSRFNLTSQPYQGSSVLMRGARQGVISRFPLAWSWLTLERIPPLRNRRASLFHYVWPRSETSLNHPHRRQCKVISGGQLRRTGRTLDPAPTEV
jgi:hypothetical protein